MELSKSIVQWIKDSKEDYGFVVNVLKDLWMMGLEVVVPDLLI